MFIISEFGEFKIFYEKGLTYQFHLTLTIKTSTLSVKSYCELKSEYFNGDGVSLAMPRKKIRKRDLSSGSRRNQQDVVQAEDEDQERIMHLHNLVFGIDLVRETILDFVVHDVKGQLSQSNTISCRLVQRAWLESVTKCLLKSGQPLLKFSLSTNFKFDKYPAFGQFLEAYTSSSRVLNRVPPFKLAVNFGSQQIEEKWNKLHKCLRFCNSGLGSLYLEFSFVDLGVPINHRFQILDANESLSLPNLKKLALKFLYVAPGRSDEKDALSRNITYAVQTILSASKNLTCFSLEGNSRYTTPVPMALKNLLLPVTLTQLDLTIQMSNLDLEQPMMNTLLSRLTRLTFCVPSVPYDGNELIYRILERVRRTLKTLKIMGVNDTPTWRQEEVIPIKLPVMLSLESMLIHAINCELVNEVPNLATLLPKVKEIDLHLVAPRRLLINEEQLIVTLAEPGSSVFTIRNEVTLPFTRWLHQAFPRVTKLSISTAVSSTNVHQALQHLFHNMTLLEKMSLTFIETSQHSRGSLYWRSLFLGVPILDRVPVELPYIRPLSIQNLSELCELELCLLDTSESNPAVLSNFVFDFAFLRMPKLVNLKLSGNFRISPVMARRWKHAGRVIQIP